MLVGFAVENTDECGMGMRPSFIFCADEGYRLEVAAPLTVSADTNGDRERQLVIGGRIRELQTIGEPDRV